MGHSAPPPSLRARAATVAIDNEVLLPRRPAASSRERLSRCEDQAARGKTTLLRACAGLVPLSDGALAVHGQAPQPLDASFRSALAALIGSPPLARDLTLGEHLELVALSWNDSAAKAAARAVDILDQMGLGALVNRFPHELSSGQQQLFALCLTLIRPSTVLVLDEPEQRLDADRRAVLAAILRDRAAAGTAVLMATHSSELVRDSGARTVQLGATGA